jgi:hypothetical protein
LNHGEWRQNTNNNNQSNTNINTQRIIDEVEDEKVTSWRPTSKNNKRTKAATTSLKLVNCPITCIIQTFQWKSGSKTQPPRRRPAGPGGFAPHSLNTLHDISWDVHVERLLGIALYMAWNVIPFVLPLLAVLSYTVFPGLRHVVYFVLVYVITLDVIMRFFFTPYFIKKYKLVGSGKDDNQSTSFFSLLGQDVYANQFLYTERNITKYLSTKFVWPRSLQRPNMQSPALIFCVVPHGVAPIGITAYPLWSRLWNDKLCHWTAAPSVLNIPLVGYFMKKLGGNLDEKGRRECRYHIGWY